MRTEKRKQQQMDHKLRKRAELRIKILDYLDENPCIGCGETDPLVLEFDHRDRDTKISSVSRLVNDCCSWETIQTEIDKCDILCANCHRRKTHKQLKFWKQIEDVMACRLNGRTADFGSANLGSSPSVPANCCSLKNPCKHWKYEGQEGYWFNELTGEIREV